METLRIGDKVTTQQGHVARVRWVGRQTFHTRYAGGKLGLVRVRRGALGAGLPNRDLVLTADHALLVDGLLVNAGALVNHTSITFEPLADLPETVTVYHVETDNHDLILANGVPSETFIDYVGRSAFDNFDEYLEIYGAERIIREMAYPRVSARRMVPESVRARLNGAPDAQGDTNSVVGLRA